MSERKVGAPLPGRRRKGERGRWRMRRVGAADPSLAVGALTDYRAIPVFSYRPGNFKNSSGTSALRVKRAWRTAPLK